MTIELEGRFIRGRGSVDEYLEQTAIANPHVTLHYNDPEGNETTYSRSTTQLPAEPKEIKPHPYGIELGRLVTMLKDTHAGTMSQFLTESFSRVSSGVAQKICEAAKISTRANPKRIGRQEADALYQAIQNTKISAPATDCISPIGEPLILKGLHQLVPGEFFCAATRPPAVYRGNPFLIEVGLAYGGVEPDAEGLARSADRVARRKRRPHAAAVPDEDVRRHRQRRRRQDSVPKPRWARGKARASSKKDEIAQLHAAMKNVNLTEGQIDAGAALRQPRAAAVSAGGLRDHAVGHRQQLAVLRPVAVARATAARPGHRHGPHGQRLGAVHQRIERSHRRLSRNQKELRLGLQAVGRKLGDVPQSAANGEAGRRARGDLPALPGRSGRRPSRQSRTTTTIRERISTTSCCTSRNARPPKPTRSSTTAARRSKPTEEDFGENVLIVEPGRSE